MDTPEKAKQSIEGHGNLQPQGDLHARDITINVAPQTEGGGRQFGPPERLAHIRFYPLRKKFAGRKALLDALAQQLTPGQVHSLSQRAAVKADGGVGKTAVAVELAWRLFDERKFDYVFLLDATSAQSLDNDLTGLCERRWLNLPEQEAREQAVRADVVQRWLKIPGNAGRTLLILDGADTDEARAKVRALHLELPGCALLVTSRQSVGGGIKEEKLDLFTPGEAREFLRSHLDRPSLSGAEAEPTLDGIAKAVDHLPLALELVASYLRQSHQSPQEWLREWQHTPAHFLEHPPGEHTQYPVSLSRVWEQSVARLSAEARAHLAALAWFAPRPAGFPVAAVRGKEVWTQIREAFPELEKAALVQWEQDADAVTIHRVLQAVTRHRLTGQEKADSRSLAVSILDDALPDPQWNEAGWLLWERLAPHLHSVLAAVRDTEEEVKATRLMNDFGAWLRERAQNGEAEPLYRRALEIDEKIYGEDHPNVAIEINNLAQLLQATNRLAEAEPLMRRALEINEMIYGKDHPDVAIDICNLAQLLQDTNRLAEAGLLMRRALAIDEKSYGKDHPNVARDLNNLAQLLQATNRLAEAESLMRRALEINEKSYGKDHPDVAINLNNLAHLLQTTDRLAEAKPLMERVMSIFEKSYGKEHPNIATALNNLAQLLQATNRVAEAEPLMRRALKLNEKSCGKDHPDVAIALNNLAQLLQATNRVAEAEPLMRRALEIDEKSYGKDHPDVAINLSNLARLLQDTNRLVEAEPLMVRALEIDEKSYGKEHPKVASRLNNLARLLHATNRLVEAEPLMRRALEIDEKSYGKDHPKVAIRLNNLAQLLQDTNRLAKAEPLMRRALEILLRSQFRVGHELSQVGVVLRNYRKLLAEVGWSQERIEEQLKMLAEQCKQDAGKEQQ